MASPICTVNGSSTVGGVNVSPASTVTVALADLAGVKTWALSIVGTDELVSAPALSINSVTKTATFTGPPSGSALILKSVVNGGLDANGNVDASLSTTFGVYTLSVYGTRVLAAGETLEGHQTHGWVKQINTAIRAGSGTYAPGSSPFVVVSADGLLTNERVLTGGSGISITDGGSTVTVSASGITDSNISAGAGIAGSKVMAAFGTQNVSTGWNFDAQNGARLRQYAVTNDSKAVTEMWQLAGETGDATPTQIGSIAAGGADSIIDIIATVVATKSDGAAKWKNDVEACFSVAANVPTEMGTHTRSTPKTLGTTTGLSLDFVASGSSVLAKFTGRVGEFWRISANITTVKRTVTA